MRAPVMGEIDLDPASCLAANKVVQALNYYTKQDSGMELPWYGRVFLNPPFSNPLREQFIDKLIAKQEAGRIMEAVVVTNQSSGRWHHKLLERYPVVEPKHHELHPNARIEFYPLPGNDRGTNNNNGGQTIWYVPHRHHPLAGADLFFAVFGEFCTVPWRSDEGRRLTMRLAAWPSGNARRGSRLSNW